MNAVHVSVLDWTQSRRADLDEVPTETTVGELVDAVKEAMALPPRTPYDLIRRDEKLPRGVTLQQVGVVDGEELTVAPEVSAG